jgi:ABC-type uncharacterized transport system permease subunit
MADIDVVKKRSRTWLWIVLAIAVVLAIWFLMTRTTPAGQANIPQGGQPYAAALRTSTT